MYGIDNTPINKQTMKIICDTFGAMPVVYTEIILGDGVYLFFDNVKDIIQWLAEENTKLSTGDLV